MFYLSFSREATLGPPSDDPFDRIVSKAQSQQTEGGGDDDDGADNDVLTLALYRNGEHVQ